MPTEDEIKRIYTEEYIGQHIGGTTLNKKYPFDIYYWFTRYKLPMRNDQEKNRKYPCQSNFFENIDTDEKAYWLGFAFADGYITKATSSVKSFNISLCKSDYNHLVKFAKAIHIDKPIRCYKVSQGYNTNAEYCRISIQDEEFTRNIMKQGCIERKSNILQPPNIDKPFRAAFIRGFMDGNGSITITNTKYGETFCVKFISTEAMLNWIMDVLIEDGILKRRYPFFKRKKNQIVSSFEFGGNKLVQKYLDYVYKDATVYLDRKYDRYLRLLDINKKRGYKIA